MSLIKRARSPSASPSGSASPEHTPKRPHTDLDRRTYAPGPPSLFRPEHQAREDQAVPDIADGSLSRVVVGGTHSPRPQDLRSAEFRAELAKSPRTFAGQDRTVSAALSIPEMERASGSADIDVLQMEASAEQGHLAAPPAIIPPTNAEQFDPPPLEDASALTSHPEKADDNAVGSQQPVNDCGYAEPRPDDARAFSHQTILHSPPEEYAGTQDSQYEVAALFDPPLEQGSHAPDAPHQQAIPAGTGIVYPVADSRHVDSASHWQENAPGVTPIYLERQKAPASLIIGFTNAHNRKRNPTPTNRLSTTVREVMRELLGFGPKGVFLRPHPPVDIAHLAAFLDGGHGPRIDDLRLDLVTTADGVKSHWNATAATLFALAFLDRLANGDFEEGAFYSHETTLENIRKLFLSKVRTFRDIYQKLNGLFRLRKRTCRPDGPLKALKPLIDLVDDEMVSGDETDAELSKPGLKVFRRVEKAWVNPEITRIFHVLIDGHIDVPNALGELGAGAHFRQRINHPPAGVVHSGVVVGLPANFYNPRWLDRLSPMEKRELRMNPNQVDLAPFMALVAR
ncbi:hypothetical protein AURDEDRAFT_159327 [Auricularia subglabra TFB-10046 SS5]|nr:hypothetical protein AURDEDRAFT_159327 [Auricularia subglabra TFB-10046 SS5]